ncbi:hypothetical protein AWZ03_015208, partial [Drosophila navojoa]
MLMKLWPPCFSVLQLQAEPVGEKIIYLDKDTLAVNANLKYAVLNDKLELIQPDCHAYEADHTGRPHTIISC